MPDFEKVVIVYEGLDKTDIIAVVPLLLEYDNPGETFYAEDVMEQLGGRSYQIVTLYWL